MDSLISPTAISAFNLTGAVMSAFGSLFVVAAYFFVDFKKDALRKRLILSLAVANLVNSVDNTASGFAALHRIPLRGPWCTVNGFIGQWSIVTSDLTVFAIAVATLMSIKKPVQWHQNFFWAQRNSLAVVLGMWAYGLATALGALSSAGYVQSSPNWCWIAPTPAYARYVFTHGLRFVIIFAIMCIYARIYFILKSTAMNRGYQGVIPGPPPTSADLPLTAENGGGPRRKLRTSTTADDRIHNAMKMMIVFPALYTILWIPGLVNRLYNLAAPGQSLPVLDLLQGLTQWIGFANGVAYNLNLEVQGVLKGAFTGARHPRGGETERRAATP